jgi:UDP-2,3-diacylglucosamine diphosphatase
MASLFISDLHLCPSRPQINRLFLDFLAGPARQADTLYILGDLFEYWAGDDDLDDPFNAEICAGLRILSKSGVPLFFMAGNRDFLAGDGFASKAGLTLLPDPVLVEIAGRASCSCMATRCAPTTRLIRISALKCARPSGGSLFRLALGSAQGEDRGAATRKRGHRSVPNR